MNDKQVATAQRKKKSGRPTRDGSPNGVGGLEKTAKRARNRFLPKAKSATNKAPAKSQLIAVVLICKNISSRKKSVTEPKTKTKRR